jgi:hypothetical protein
MVLQRGINQPFSTCSHAIHSVRPENSRMVGSSLGVVSRERDWRPYWSTSFVKSTNQRSHTRSGGIIVCAQLVGVRLADGVCGEGGMNGKNEGRALHALILGFHI